MTVNILVAISWIFVLLSVYVFRKDLKVIYKNFLKNLDWTTVVYAVLDLSVKISLIFICLKIDFLKFSLKSLWDIMSNILIVNSDGVSLILSALILPLLPLLAYIEEKIFRENKETIKSQLISNSIFALSHLPMLIPFAALPGLFMSGMIYSFCYKRELSKNKENAIYRSTTVHGLSNAVLIFIILVALCIDLF